MHTVRQALPTSKTNTAIECEQWQLFQEVVALHGRLQTGASANLFRLAHRAWEATFLDNQPTLRVIEGGRGAE